MIRRNNILGLFSFLFVFAVKAQKPVLLVANKHSNTLSFIDIKTLKVLKTIPTGPNPHEIDITPDQHKAYLSSYEPPGNTISVVDLINMKMIRQIPTGDIGRIHGVALSQDGKDVYFTAGQSGDLVDVDTRNDSIKRIIPTHGEISHMVYISPDDTKLYTANIVSENISVIDRTSGDLLYQIPAGKGVEGMAFTPDGKWLWAANQTGGTITVIEVATRKPVKTFDCRGMPVRIRFSKDGKTAYIPSWTKKGELIVVDVDLCKEIKRIPVGDFAIGTALSPDGKLLFVGCEDAVETSFNSNGTESLKLNQRKSEGVHVIDTQTLTIINIIETGLGPDPMIIWYPPKNWWKLVVRKKE